MPFIGWAAETKKLPTKRRATRSTVSLISSTSAERLSSAKGIKDKAPGIFLGDKLGRGRKNSPRFDIALDPIDGTTNMSKGLPNSICVMAAAHVPEGQSHGMINIPSFYAEKLLLRADRETSHHADENSTSLPGHGFSRCHDARGGGAEKARERTGRCGSRSAAQQEIRPISCARKGLPCG